MASQTHLNIGDKAPHFTLPCEDESSLDLAQLCAKQKVVLYFYPKDATPGCTTEAKDFRDLKDEFAKANTVIVGISKDSPASHAKFIAKQALNFSLASDENDQTCEDYGVWVLKNMYGKKYMGIQRATFLVNKTGEIAALWPKVKVDGHAQEVLAAAKALN